MKTTINGISVEKAVKVAKSFVASLRKKNASRPILQRALVTETHVIATDSHRLIRIKHNEHVKEPYLHHYKTPNDAMDASNYPQVDRLFPSLSDAREVISVNVAEWIQAHDTGLVAAKERTNKMVTLHPNGYLEIPPVLTKLDKDGKEIENDPFNQIRFSHQLLDQAINIDKTSYNCEYMLQAMKALKQLGYKETTLQWYGHLRPMYITTLDELVEILILPVRTV